MDRYLVVMLGAAFGGLARYVVGVAVMQRFPVRFPLGTLVVNVSGCFLIGVLMALFTGRLTSHPNWRLLLVTGVLGGYTTFSSFGWESYQAIQDGNRWIGLSNILLSVALGYLAVWCGAWLVRR